MAPKAAPAEGQIFKATYSGVPVYECVVNDVAVMRRKADGWLNATQILKVVGLDKPQRTRVLERDVQKSTHEKVQGGYGKYQGTWIPLESAIKLAQSYNIHHLIDPLTSYVASAESPPPAPKHTTLAGTRPKKGPTAAEIQALARARKDPALDSDSEDDALGGVGGAGGLGGASGGAGGRGRGRAGSEGSMSPSPSDVSSSSRTPSPISSRPNNVPEYYQDGRINGGGSGARSNAAPYGQDAYDHVGYGVRDDAGLSRYAEIILDYFISESTTIPPLLINPPPDFDANMSIDDDEHTALHWACAMGRIRVVKLLLSAGADVFRVNTNGQTALMRAAMFSNNYDLRKFPELFELLHRSILNIDRNDRTVFHHVVDLALTRGKPHAARYYLETMVTRLSEYGSQLADMLNFQDDEGETPLTMAARARSKRLVRLLLEYGADPKVRNKEGKNAEEYIIEDERFRASPSRALTGGGIYASDGTTPLLLPSAASLHTSEAGQRAGGRTVQLMTKLLHQLADSFDAELGGTDKRLTQANNLLAQIQAEIKESDQIRASVQKEADGDDAEKNKVDRLKTDLTSTLRKRSAGEMQESWNVAQENVKRARLAHGLAEDALMTSGEADASAPPTAAQNLLAPAAPNLLASLREIIAEVRQQHSSLIEEFVQKAQAQGTGKTMAAYRRLISAGCGGIQTEEIDAVVTALCDLLDENSAPVQEEEPIRPKEAAALLRGVAASTHSAHS